MSVPFDPAKHLMSLKGKDYLEVKWRLVWLRTDHPDATIDTDCVSFNETFAVFKATVTIPSGGSATGYGSEERGHFPDYIEKAETKAIGRALGALGYGTQFADDFADGPSGRIADAPVQRNKMSAVNMIDGKQLRDDIVNASKAKDAARTDNPAPSWTAIYKAGNAKGLNPTTVQEIACKRYGLEHHSKMSADNMIDLADYLNPTDAASDAQTLAEDLVSVLENQL